MNNYTEPTLCPEDGDMSKEWFVYFRYTDPVSGKKISVKKRWDLNKFDKKKEREKRSSFLIYLLKKKLEEGWNPITDKVEKSREQKTLIEILEEINEAKKANIERRSIKTYNKILYRFIDFLKEKRYHLIYPAGADSKLAHEYMDYLSTEKKYVGKTYNNHIDILKVFFNAMVDREIIDKNPFTKIKRAREKKGKNFPFTEEEKRKLKEYFEKKDRHFYRACMLTYYCFLRRTELIELKVEDIDLINKTIIVHSKGSKNNTQQSVTIPLELEPILEEMNLNKYPGHYYVFGNKISINEKPTKNEDYISEKFRKIADSLGLDKKKGFYAHKHSGICELAKNKNITPYEIMKQARHTDLKTTIIYMESMGLTVNDKIREANFSFYK